MELKGKKIAFLGHDKDTDKTQIFVMNADGTGRTRVSKVERGVTCFMKPINTKTIAATPMMESAMPGTL